MENEEIKDNDEFMRSQQVEQEILRNIGLLTD